jgi:3-hydroxyisobutyrate dehydrogenase-like beta-hydroxyacid dehydrogenase
MTHIAFIGFGEAAQAMAQGLCDEQRVAGLCAYDPRFADAAGGPELRERARERGVRVAETPADAVSGADLVLSLVVGSAAVAVGEAMAPVLQPGQIFVDLNSISPDAKQAVGLALATGGRAAQFVEGAVMARVLPYRHKVPILLAGPAAERAAGLMRGVGMQVEPVGDRIGQACAVKMIRSVIVKGIEALLLESLTAAERCGVRERILDSIGETFPGLDWRQVAAYFIGRTRQHGARRVTEMKEAAATLRGFGLEPRMAEASGATIAAAHARFEASDVPLDADLPALLAVLAAAE